MANLFVQDEEFRNAAKQYLNQAEKVEQMVTEYTAILQAIAAEKALEGEAGTALMNFSSLAEGYVGGEIATIFQRYQTKNSGFVNNVEAEDEAEIS